MSFATNRDLPRAVRLHLPAHGQDIYREVFNHAFAAHAGEAEREELAHRIAWAAVKRAYVRVRSAWVSRNGEDAALIGTESGTPGECEELALELRPKIGMGNGDQRSGPPQQVLAVKIGNAVLGHHIVNVCPRGDHATATIEHRDYSRHRPALGGRWQGDDGLAAL